MKKEQNDEIKIEGRLDASFSKNFHEIELDVPAFTSRLEIFFDYSPRAIAGVDNHLNLLIYDSLGHFVGRYDRGTEKFVISPDDPSPCAEKTLPLPGRWRFLLESHSLSSSVAYKIDVRVSGSEEYFWKRGELHTHSIHSDGVMSVSELSDYLHTLGVDFFFLTDHSNTTGWRDLSSLRGATGFPGEELNTFKGHGLVLGAKVFIDWKEADLKQTSPVDIYELVRKTGGLFGVAHPFIPGDPLCVGCEWKYDVSPFNFDFVEVWSQFPKDFSLLNYRTLFLWLENLRKGNKVTGVAGSDLHTPRDEDKEALRTEVKVRSVSLSEILYGIKNGMVCLNNGTLKSFKINGIEAGETVCCRDNVRVRIETERMKKVELIMFSKKEIFHVEPTPEAEFELSLDSFEAEDFLLLWIKDTHARTLALTNPIFLKREERE
ncbi:MAG: hypothetical protein PWP37_465 [Thermotogota bacterium]|nr:hypothetical protein [Thermotogota bacterium]MDK2864273.1 hypothetical protein [Thermotogota bacterium]HCZ06629.1 hypothetical protein [Thermotogota bacterium]